MRSLALAAAAILSGCAYLQEPPACGTTGSESGDFRPVEISFLNDGDIAGRLCVELNGEGPFEAVIERADRVPNAGRVESAAVAGDRLEVVAWMAGSDKVAREAFQWHPQNFVVIVTQSDATLRIDHFAEQPVSS